MPQTADLPQSKITHLDIPGSRRLFRRMTRSISVDASVTYVRASFC